MEWTGLWLDYAVAQKATYEQVCAEPFWHSPKKDKPPEISAVLTAVPAKAPVSAPAVLTTVPAEAPGSSSAVLKTLRAAPGLSLGLPLTIPPKPTRAYILPDPIPT
jgi:hypothetical protein